jgi:large subunit ribosomal protein LP2
LNGKDVSGWFSVGGGSGGAPAKDAEAPKGKVEEKKKVVEEAPVPEEDVDMGGLFDF